MRAKQALFIASSALATPMIGHLSAYAYANTLTRLIPDLYAALDVVSRELVGFIPSVTRNVGAERAAVGQAVVFHITPSMGTFNVTPAMNTPEPADVTVGNDTIVISKSKGVEFGWTGEEQRGLNHGAGYLTVQADLFAQALRTLTNEIEVDLGVEANLKSSRAIGTAGATPFASDVEASALARQVLDDNGAPQSERSLVGNTSMGAKLRTLQNLTRVNEAGTSMGLRDGELLNLNGLSVKESAGVQRHTAGTNSGSTTDGSAYAIGARTITLASAGTGTHVAGDVITFAGDTNKYVVESGDTNVANGGTIVLQKPGLRQAIPASATLITTIASHASNIAFARNALHLVCRAPALPQEGDAAIDRLQLTDPRSGIVFEVAIYAGYRKIRAEVVAAWGVKMVKPEHSMIVLG